MPFLFRRPEMPRPGEELPGRAEPIVLPGAHAVSERSLTPPWPHGMRVLDVALGCFWGAEQAFWGVPGVWVTMVGYQGGATPNPTYKEVCGGRTGHAEVVRVVYDPAQVPVEELLRIFWEHHDPTQGYRQGNDVGTQYRSAIFTHDAEQLAAALASRDAYQRELTRAGFGQVTTEIREAPPFYYAEDYHQQYLVKVPDGYCPDHGTGVACPVGLGVRANADG
jgi:peptide-methionine (S)-S-oxide reductase